MSMVQCPNCNITFNAAFRRCPQCGEFEAPFSALAKTMAVKAEALLESGESRRSVEQLLIEEGFSEAQATQLVALCRRKVSRRTRSHGLFRIMVGLGSLLLGGVAIGTLLVVPVGQVRGRVLGLFGVLGAGVFLFGCFATISGISSILTGRESRVVAPEWLESLLGSED